MARRRSADLFSGPNPLRIRHRSSFPWSRIWGTVSMAKRPLTSASSALASAGSRVATGCRWRFPGRCRRPFPSANAASVAFVPGLAGEVRLPPRRTRPPRTSRAASPGGAAAPTSTGGSSRPGSRRCDRSRSSPRRGSRCPRSAPGRPRSPAAVGDARSGPASPPLRAGPAATGAGKPGSESAPAPGSGSGSGAGAAARPGPPGASRSSRRGPGSSGPGRCTNSARPSAPREPRHSTRSRQSCRVRPDRGAGASAPEIPPPAPARPAQWSAPTGSRPQVRIDFHAGHESPSGFQSPAFSAILLDSGRWLNQIFALPSQEGRYSPSFVSWYDRMISTESPSIHELPPVSDWYPSLRLRGCENDCKSTSQ